MDKKEKNFSNKVEKRKRLQLVGAGILREKGGKCLMQARMRIAKKRESKGMRGSTGRTNKKLRKVYHIKFPEEFWFLAKVAAEDDQRARCGSTPGGGEIRGTDVGGELKKGGVTGGYTK